MASWFSGSTRHSNRVEGDGLVLGVGRDREVDAAQRRLAGNVGSDPGYFARLHLLKTSGAFSLADGIDEGVVDHEADCRTRSAGARGPRSRCRCSPGRPASLPSAPISASASIGLRRLERDLSGSTDRRARGRDHRVRPHDEALVLVGLDLDAGSRARAVFSACSIISAQVVGAFGTRSLRYQSSCVFDQIGTA